MLEKSVNAGYLAYNLHGEKDLNEFEAEMGEIWWLRGKMRKKRDALGGYVATRHFSALNCLFFELSSKSSPCFNQVYSVSLHCALLLMSREQKYFWGKCRL